MRDVWLWLLLKRGGKLLLPALGMEEEEEGMGWRREWGGNVLAGASKCGLS